MICEKNQSTADRITLKSRDVVLPSPNNCGWEMYDIFKKFSQSSIPVQKIQDMNDGMRKCAMGVEKNESLIDPVQCSPANKLRLNCPPSYRSTTLNPYSYAPIQPWNPQPQFWYHEESAHKGPTWPVGNPDDYRFQPLQYPRPPAGQLKEAIEIERPERYLPGEIYKNKTPKEPIEDLQGTGGCKSVWEPKQPEIFYSKFDESTLPKQPLLADMVNEKEAELRRLIIRNKNHEQEGVASEINNQKISQQKHTKVLFKPDIDVVRNDMMQVRGQTKRNELFNSAQKIFIDDNQKKGILNCNDQTHHVNRSDKECARKCFRNKCDKKAV